MSQRKIVSLEEAVACVPNGASLGLGGWIFNAQPMALVRALIRKGARDLDLIPAPSSIGPDMLIGAGCVRRTACVFISFEQFGLAPHFRRCAEAGTIEVVDLDGPAIAGGLRASICDLPWNPIPDLGTDLPRHAPDYYLELPSAPGQRKMLAAKAIRPDVCFIHAQQADEFGNVQHLASPFFDVMLAQASGRVIVQVDRIVSTDTIRRHNHLTKLPAAMVDAVVEVPWGAHPSASPTAYRADEAHLAEYVKASADEKRFAAYLQKYVHDVPSQSDYLDALSGGRLASLAVSETTLS